MARKRRKRTKRLYFTQVHEDAIVAYNNTEDPKERTLLYAKYIQPAFNEECKIYLTTILNKYNPDKGSKAFSYFSVITKNWFIHKVKKNNIQHKREIDIDDLTVDHQLQYASVTMKYEEQRQQQEFWDLLWGEIETLSGLYLFKIVVK